MSEMLDRALRGQGGMDVANPQWSKGPVQSFFGCFFQPVKLVDEYQEAKINSDFSCLDSFKFFLNDQIHLEESNLRY